MVSIIITILTIVVHISVITSLLIFERRHPSATLAWLLTCIFLPGLGIALYLIIGRTRAKRVAKRCEKAAKKIDRILKRFDIRDKLRLTHDRKIDHRTQTLLKLGDGLSTTPSSRGNQVQMLVNADQAYTSMLDAIENAQHHVHVEFYIIRPDDTGIALRDILVKVAKRGVEVKVLVDAIGSSSLGRNFWTPLIEAGGKAERFPPCLNILRWLMRRDRIDFRNHRKIVVVDGAIGFTGGINIGKEYLGLDPDMGNWRDSHLAIKGPAALSLQEVFAEDWYTATQELLEDEAYYPEPDANPAGDLVVQIIDSGPDRNWSPIEHVYMQAFALAESRIWIASPYFVPSAVIEESLITANLRGVDVRILVPRKPDHKIVAWAARSYFPRLLEAGAKIYEYGHGFLHAKTLLIDQWVGTIGSANMDMRSFHLNFELNAFVYGPEFAETLAAQFQQDLSHASPVTLEYLQNLPYRRRLLYATARLLSPIL